MYEKLLGAEPKRLTNRERARYLLDELKQYDYMAQQYKREAAGIAAGDRQREHALGSRDADLEGRDDAPATQERKQRRARRSSHWYAADYAEKARRLREELGDAFLEGSWQKRDDLMRRWRKRWKDAGLLP
jgi:hypothetical protein